MAQQKGVDVSQFQGSIDWNLLAPAITFAFIRSNAGLYADATFRRNWAEAKRVGTRRGAYLYYYQTVNAGDQAKAMVDAVGSDWGELPPVVDVEDGNAVWTAAQVESLKWCLRIIEALSGKTPMIYTRKTYWDVYLGKTAWNGRYGLWTAYWSYDPLVQPAIPNGWSKWDYWQYSNKGTLPGITENVVDLNVAQGEVAPPVTAHPAPVFTASRTQITAGESVTLAWDAPGASGIWLNSAGVTGPANSTVVQPHAKSGASVYTLLVSYPGEPVTMLTVTVSVTAAPEPMEVAQGHIGIHLVWDGDSELDIALQSGCRMAHSMSMDQCIRAANKLGKTAVFDGKGIVMRRLWLDAQWPSNADKFISDVLSYGDKRLIYGGPNECEGLRGDTVKAILDHARFDVYVGTELAKRGYYYAFGVYAVGNPDITKLAEVKALHDGYAEYWNTLYDRYGIWPIEDKHTYSPNATHMYDLNIVVNTMTRWDGSTIQVATTEQDWHETRQAWNFRLCGWKIDKGLVISGETGIDEGGSGGFPAHGLGATDIVKWGKAYRIAMRRPVTDMYGTTMPMRWVGSTIFQAVDRGTGKGQWGSYCIGDHLGQIGAIY